MRSGTLYVFLQAVLLGSIVLVPAIDPFRWAPSLLSQLLGALGLVGAVAILGFAFRALGRATTPNPVPKANAPLVTTGIYSRIRHPMYTALLTGALGWAIAMRSPFALFAFLNFALFLHSKASLEESLLVEKFGRAYEEYRARTGKFLPRRIRAD